MTGRARGRGVARGRGAPAGAPAAEPARRPGSGAPPQAGGDNASNNPPAAGRASLRGSARGEPRPGAGAVPNVVTQMAQMSIGTGSADGGRRGRREMNFSEPHTRPAHLTDKKGKSGSVIPLMSNYFKIIAAPGWHLYQYQVDFSDVDLPKVVRKGMMNDHKELFSCHLFDGMQLYSPTKLPNEFTEVFSQSRRQETPIRITIKRVAELAPNTQQCLHIFNIMMRQMLEDVGMKEVQRAYFSQEKAVKLQKHRMEIWPGFKTSILQYEESVMLNVDLSHKVLRTDTVLDILYDLHKQATQRGGEQAYKENAIRKLVGEIVLTRYNDKTYRIDDINFAIDATCTFKRNVKGVEEEISYQKYYQEVHNIKVREAKQPLLVSRPKKKDQRPGAPEVLYLLPELCTMTGITDEVRANFTVMKDLAVHTRIDPTRRVETCNEFMSLLKSNPQAQARLKGWGLEFEKTLVKLDGRVLPLEKIIMGSDRGNQPRPVQNRDADWRNGLRGNLFTTVALNKWAIIFCERDRDITHAFLQTLQQVGPPMGIRINSPASVSLPNESTAAMLEAIKAQIDPDLQMIVVMLPSDKKDRYDAVKKQCCVETPVATQCVQAKKLLKAKNGRSGIMSYVSMTVIQMNCKLGGEAWALEVPIKNSMVVGIDTYHDSAKKGRSVGGFVASLNSTFTRYYSQTIFQSSMQELIDGLKSSMQAALKKYHSVNGDLPERIFVYRDGVGDGQLPAVVEHEVQQILEATKSFGQNYTPKITIIVVKKRISSRFFLPYQNKFDNPKPGTIVDCEVTRAESYDFFLIAQSVRQGTVTPTHYNVIWDTSGLKPDHIQRLTYKLTHLYYNWPLKDTMVVGYDTYHDSAKKGRSVAGVVCSLNRNFTRWYSQCAFQHSMEELVSQLNVIIVAGLKKYYEVNQSLPMRIFVFRDGVGDGQLPAVVEHEVSQIRNALKEVSPNNEIKLSFIVVKKRISSRFFHVRQPNMGNPSPGTVVDTACTRPESYDFFLISQSVRQGTVTPTHYNVIWDTSGLKPDHIQRLTYKLTHLYYNWPGTVRVPAPCQYAHKLAFLIGQSVHRNPSITLADKLYYL